MSLISDAPAGSDDSLLTLFQAMSYCNKYETFKFLKHNYNHNQDHATPMDCKKNRELMHLNLKTFPTKVPIIFTKYD